MCECRLYIVSFDLVCLPDRAISVERSVRGPAFCLQHTELFSVYSAASPTSIGCASQHSNDLAAENCVKQTANTAGNEVHAAALRSLSIRDLLCESGKKEFLRLIQKHSFMILTGTLDL